jgi:hypothetical protein
VAFPEKQQAVEFVRKRFPKDITRLIDESGQEQAMAKTPKYKKRQVEQVQAEEE